MFSYLFVFKHVPGRRMIWHTDSYTCYQVYTLDFLNKLSEKFDKWFHLSRGQYATWVYLLVKLILAHTTWLIKHGTMSCYWRQLNAIPFTYMYTTELSCHHLTHCGLVTSYGGIDLGQHWVGQRFVVWRHRAITGTMCIYHQICSVAITWEQIHK